MKSLPAKREPVLRETRYQYLHGDKFVSLIRQRIYNLEAIYAQVTSEEVFMGDEQCDHCARESGLYTECVGVPGERHCANCHHGSQYQRCSFNKTVMPQLASAEPSIDMLDGMIVSETADISQLENMLERRRASLKQLEEWRAKLALARQGVDPQG
jgi:hypothetical protein